MILDHFWPYQRPFGDDFQQIQGFGGSLDAGLGTFVVRLVFLLSRI